MLTDEVRDQLRQLALCYGLSASNVLERLIEYHYKKWDVPGLKRIARPEDNTRS